jgi:hypothetical protein
VPHWRIQTAPSRDGEALTGIFTDSDLAFRLNAFGTMIVRAEAAAREAQAAFDRDVASGRKNNQGRIVDEAVKVLAERRRG